MTKQFRLWRRAAALAGATALVAGVAAVAPAASSAHSVTTCANKQVKISPEGSKAIKIPVKAITTEGGVPCATAYKVITSTLEGKTPSGWKYFAAQFEAPEGLIPQGLKNGSKKIKYAVRGG